MVKIGLQIRAFLESVSELEAEGEDFRLMVTQRSLWIMSILNRIPGPVWKTDAGPENFDPLNFFSDLK